MKYKLPIILIITLMFSTKSFAASQANELQPCVSQQINKTLNLSVNSARLLTFDEKIIRYKFKNEKSFKAEILSNIFNTRQELLIKPINELNNTLTVWTDSKIYNLNIKFEQNQEFKIREISGNELFMDKSSVFPEDSCGMTDFKLDNPPKITKVN